MTSSINKCRVRFGGKHKVTVFGKLSKEENEFNATLGYTVNFRTGINNKTTTQKPK